MDHVHTRTCLSNCNASLHPCSIDLAFFHPPPTSNHLLQTSNGRDRWFGKATEFSDTLGRSVFTPEITHFIQRPSYEDHCGEKDDVDDQVRVFVELCYNLDLLVVIAIDTYMNHRPCGPWCTRCMAPGYSMLNIYLTYDPILRRGPLSYEVACSHAIHSSEPLGLP